MPAPMTFRAFISGLSGQSLTDGERAFLGDARPCGIVLFKRNCGNPGQVRSLVDAARAAAGDGDLLVLIDQEGGRVQRLGPPHWPVYPPPRAFGRMYARDPAIGLEAARLGARLIARDLHPLGINVDCIPVLDVPVEGAHDVIGDRAYGGDPECVSALGRAAAEGLMEGGVLPVIKHMPGHGRACADSHHGLPVIDASPADLEACDFPPFAALAGMPIAMTAHVLLKALDAQRPASVSKTIISEVIRDRIGFGGLLMSDDLSMGALTGSPGQRARAVIAAGCDVALHCNGKMAEMREVAEETPELMGKGAKRFAAALARLSPPKPFDEARAEALLAEALEMARQ